VTGRPEGVGPPGESGSPWRRADVLTLPLPYAIGAACLALASADGSRGLTVAHQVDPLNLGIAGLMAVGLANAVWLTSGRRRVAVRRRRLTRLLDERFGEVPAPATEAPDDPVVALVGGQRYHRPACPLVAGKPAVRVSKPERLPCGVCRP